MFAGLGPKPSRTVTLSPLLWVSVLLLPAIGAVAAADHRWPTRDHESRLHDVLSLPDNPQLILQQLGGVPEIDWGSITDPSVFFNEVGQRSVSLDLRNRIYTNPANMLNPTCGLMGLMTLVGAACPAIRVLEIYLKSSPPELHMFFQQQIHPSRASNRVLPVPLAVYDGLLPEVIDRSVAEAERRTYWWLFSAVNKVWEYMASKVHETGPLPRFPGFEIVSGWETGALMSAQTGPLAMTIHRGEHLIMLVRGSQVPQDWATNFNYTLLTREYTQGLGLVGRVHAGFGEYAGQLGTQVDDEMTRVQPRRVTVSGDSLGGAVANLLGVYIAKKHGHRLDCKVEVVGIASPRLGDEEFSTFYRTHVNGRTPSFLGEGLRLREHGRRKTTFEIGDVVTQVPWSCFPLPECHSSSGESSDEEYQYVHHGGMVLITPPMMVNAHSWEQEANWVSPAIGSNGIVATHMCVYWCWFTAGTEAHGNMCYFPRDPPRPDGSPYDICAYGTNLPPPPPLPLEVDIEEDGGLA